jgi:NAD-dependent SIR2 family protein deacetylase
LSDRSSAIVLNIYSDAARLIQQADVLLIWTGAGMGMGMDSGLPNVRGNQGFWNAYPAIKQEGLTFIELANPQGFETNAKRAWGFYGHRYQLYKQSVIPTMALGY